MLRRHLNQYHVPSGMIAMSSSANFLVVSQFNQRVILTFLTTLFLVVYNAVLSKQARSERMVRA